MKTKQSKITVTSLGKEEAGAPGAGGYRKGPWTEQEDMKLVWFVRLFGERRWDFLAKVSGLQGGG
jgi:myb proto-oncogene protein